MVLKVFSKKLAEIHIASSNEIVSRHLKSTKIMYLKQVILIFLLTSTASVIKGDEGSNHKLPSIWIEEEGEVNYYRFRAELELLEGAKVGGMIVIRLVYLSNILS